MLRFLCVLILMALMFDIGMNVQKELGAKPCSCESTCCCGEACKCCPCCKGSECDGGEACGFECCKCCPCGCQKKACCKQK